MVKPTVRDQRKLEIRNQIQKAARAQFIEYGFEKTTMRGLAEAAGVGLGTISLHFKDKNTLLLSVFYDEINAVSIEAVESVPSDSPLKEQFLSMAGALYRYYGMQTNFLRTVVKEALFSTGEWNEKFNAQLGEVLVKVVALIEAAKERGEVRRGVDSMSLGSVCWSLYLTGLIQGLGAEEFDPEVQTTALEPLLKVVFDGVLERRSYE
nr:TetR/AcrR family transcriptional regulator [uncultured Pseudodesulfovibrio sp.]